MKLRNFVICHSLSLLITQPWMAIKGRFKMSKKIRACMHVMKQYPPRMFEIQESCKIQPLLCPKYTFYHFPRWSQGLIFHQALVDCARAAILLPLGNSKLDEQTHLIIICRSVNIPLPSNLEVFSRRNCLPPPCHSIQGRQNISVESPGWQDLVRQPDSYKSAEQG